MVGLTDTQWMELYSSSIENRKDILWIREEIDSSNKEIQDCRKHINDIEINQGFNRGKVASLAIMVTALITILVNGVLWMFNSIGGK